MKVYSTYVFSLGNILCSAVGTCVITYCIGRNQLLGDVLCIASGFAQSLSLVTEEFIIKGQLSVVEYMAMLGFGGAIVTSIQLLVRMTICICKLMHGNALSV